MYDIISVVIKMIEKINVKEIWSFLKDTELPIVLYGMGNGADMIIDALDKINVKPSAVFASDGFVRGHSFRRMKVMTLKEVEELYDEFIILLTFAVHDKKMLSYIKELSERHILLSPTVPIAGTGLFTFDYVKEHDSDFEKAYNLLWDNKSKEVFLDVLKFKISGDTKYLFRCESEKNEVYRDILHLTDDEYIVDLGAYDGDTIREFTEYTGGNYSRITAFEPDEKNFRKLCQRTENFDNIKRYNLGAWDKEETLYFEKKGGRNSRKSEGSDIKSVPVSFNSVDNIVKEKVTLLKMDIEGAESKALDGAADTIKKYKPKLYVCAYHRNEDFFDLIFKIHNLNPGYKIYLRHHPYIPAWETNIYAK